MVRGNCPAVVGDSYPFKTIVSIFAFLCVIIPHLTTTAVRTAKARKQKKYKPLGQKQPKDEWDDQIAYSISYTWRSWQARLMITLVFTPIAIVFLSLGCLDVGSIEFWGTIIAIVGINLIAYINGDAESSFLPGLFFLCFQKNGEERAVVKTRITQKVHVTFAFIAFALLHASNWVMLFGSNEYAQSGSPPLIAMVVQIASSVFIFLLMVRKMYARWDGLCSIYERIFAVLSLVFLIAVPIDPRCPC